MLCSVIFLFLAPGSHFVHRSRTILAILVQGHLSNFPIKVE